MRMYVVNTCSKTQHEVLLGSLLLFTRNIEGMSDEENIDVESDEVALVLTPIFF